MEVHGTFNAQRFFDTLALILSEREKVKITVKVTQPPADVPEDQRTAAEKGGEKNGSLLHLSTLRVQP